MNRSKLAAITMAILMATTAMVDAKISSGGGSFRSAPSFRSAAPAFKAAPTFRPAITAAPKIAAPAPKVAPAATATAIPPKPILGQTPRSTITTTTAIAPVTHTTIIEHHYYNSYGGYGYGNSYFSSWWPMWMILYMNSGNHQQAPIIVQQPAPQVVQQQQPPVVINQTAPATTPQAVDCRLPANQLDARCLTAK